MRESIVGLFVGCAAGDEPMEPSEGPVLSLGQSFNQSFLGFS